MGAVEFQLYQHEIYFAGLADQTPLPCDYAGLESAAREQLDAGAHGYVAAAAGTESTVVNNRRALDAWQLVPRMMRDTSTRDLSVDVLGMRLEAPVMLAPIGVQGILHPEAEVATARAASGLGIPFMLSTASSKSLEDVAEAAGDGRRLFQLYWFNDRDVTASLVRRAEAAGYAAIVVTLDTKFLAWRPRDLKTAYLPFLRAEGVANYFTDPVFRDRLEKTPEEDPGAAAVTMALGFADKTVTWDDLAWLREQTELPVLVKGIQHVDDARAAVDHGVDGMVVSNHGGRQVDGAVGSATVLPEVVDAVDGAAAVLFDSGIRSGADIAKALCLGADAVLVGRPYAWGLGLAGADGVRHVVRSLLAELDLTMALCGLTSTAELTRDVLRPAITD